MAAANDSASARVLNALLLRFLEPSGKVAHQDTRHRFPCPYRAVLNFPGCISSSRCFVFSHVFFSGLGSCMHFPYFSGCAEVFLPNMRASL
ncbi:hypothetical protein AAAY81_08410, partial [Bifidobacterium longum]